MGMERSLEGVRVISSTILTISGSFPFGKKDWVLVWIEGRIPDAMEAWGIFAALAISLLQRRTRMSS